MNYNLIINNKQFDVEVGAVQNGYAQVFVNNELFEVDIENYHVQENVRHALVVRPAPVMTRRVQQAERPRPAAQVPPPKAVNPVPPQFAQTAKSAQVAKSTAKKPAVSATGAGAIKAPMPGLIIDIKVKVGDAVKTGQVVAIMEAMKMENDLPSTLNGTVKEIRVQKGAQVSTGDVLIVIGDLIFVK